MLEPMSWLKVPKISKKTKELKCKLVLIFQQLVQSFLRRRLTNGFSLLGYLGHNGSYNDNA